MFLGRVKHSHSWYVKKNFEVKLDGKEVFLEYDAKLNFMNKTFMSFSNRSDLKGIFTRCCFKSSDSSIKFFDEKPELYHKNSLMVCMFGLDVKRIALTVENDRIIKCNNADLLDGIDVAGCMNGSCTLQFTKYLASRNKQQFKDFLESTDNFVLCKQSHLEEAFKDDSETPTVYQNSEPCFLEESARVGIKIPFIYFDLTENQFYRCVSHDVKIQLTQEEIEEMSREEKKKMEERWSGERHEEEEQAGPSGVNVTSDD